MHTDESINAYITGDLLAGKSYHYDPKDRHGPALYAVALPLARVAGAKNLAQLKETSVRVGPVVIAALTILLFGFVAELVGFPAAALGAVLFAIAPLVVYYNRDFIHETLFVAATLVTMIFGFRLLREQSIKNGVLAGVGAGLMLACKETTVIHFAAFALAGAWWLWTARAERQKTNWRSMVKPGIAAVISFCVVMVVLYSWFGRHWAGLLDLFHAAPNMATRAGGEGHQKPAWYYLALMAGGWSGIALLAFAAWGAVDQPREIPSRRAFGTLVVYTIAILLIYSAIPYKTPWLALNFLLPLCVLAGNGFARLWQRSRNAMVRTVVVLFAIALCGVLGRDTWKRVFMDPAGEKNPYAYAQTDEDFLRLPERVQQAAMGNPAKNNLRIAVVAADPWPLPWYLRQFPNVGFWQPGQDPGKADLYITTTDVSDELGTRLQDWRPKFFGVRPEVLMILWLPPENDLSHE